jgi:hypothetical protein
MLFRIYGKIARFRADSVLTGSLVNAFLARGPSNVGVCGDNKKKDGPSLLFFKSPEDEQPAESSILNVPGSRRSRAAWGRHVATTRTPALATAATSRTPALLPRRLRRPVGHGKAPELCGG